MEPESNRLDCHRGLCAGTWRNRAILIPGVGIGLGYRSRSGAWQALASYGYGFEAIRSDGRGGQSIGIMLQIDLEARHPGGPSKLDDFRGFLREHF